MCAKPNRAKATTWYSRLVARFYDPFMDEFERKYLLARRRQLLRNIQGPVLEIGAGTGINFPLYPAQTRVVAIEPSAPMISYARRRLARPGVQARIRLVQAGVGDEKVQDLVPPGGFRSAVCTLVLCTVPDPEAAIRTIHSCLAPQGRLYVLEHIIAERAVPRIWQQMANPIWKHLAEGCHLTRSTDELIRRSSLEMERETYHTKGLRFYQAVWRKPG